MILRKNILNFRQLPEYFEILAAAKSFWALQKNSTSLSRKHLLATAGNLTANEQSNYKSYPFFLFLDIERKPKIWNLV